VGPPVGGGSGTCPVGPDGIACTLEYAPVFCGGCEYDNSCLSNAAGFSQGECQPVR
jgi:hypothetical protein